MRAAFKNLEAGKAVEGGSTITMQLVRNLYVGRERTLERKIREARLAEELEGKHSKRWILQSYLNSVPYGTVDGQTAVGVQAAAQTFFDKPAKDLTLEESALLAGLPQSPSRLNPFQNPRDALERRNKVLDKMAELGYISKRARREARRAQLGARARRPLHQDPRAVLLRLRQAAADRQVRRQHRPQGRAARVHDDRPEAPEGGARGDRLDAQLCRRPELRRRRDRPAHRLHQGDGVELQVQAQPVQPRRPGPPPARLRVQDFRARRRPSGGESTRTPPATSPSRST